MPPETNGPGTSLFRCVTQPLNHANCRNTEACVILRYVLIFFMGHWQSIRRMPGDLTHLGITAIVVLATSINVLPFSSHRLPPPHNHRPSPRSMNCSIHVCTTFHASTTGTARLPQSKLGFQVSASAKHARGRMYSCGPFEMLELFKSARVWGHVSTTCVVDRK
jgi:hypothetical protein